MALSILQNATAMAVGLTVPFSAQGGTAPYVWEVLPGGIGGTIDATGIYTSPNNTGVDEILVTDANSLTAEAPISVCTPIELVCDIIQSQMGLGVGQVYLYNQKINIPTDSSLYIAVGILSCKPFANNTSYQTQEDELVQVQSTNFQALLSIDILSRGPAARDQKEQVILALGSNYAQSQMELNSFNISLLSNSFVNLSAVDGAAVPYRFNISAQLKYFVSKTSPVSYFDSFKQPQVVPNP